MIHKYYYLLLISLIIGLQTNGQNNVLISEKTGYDQNFNDSPNAALEIRSDSKGVLVPRMSNMQISYIVNPAQGLLVFSTDDDSFYFYSSVDEEWKDISFGTGTIAIGTPVVPTTVGVALNEDDSNPDASAMLDIQSESKGFLVPRLTSIEVLSISDPSNGLLVFDRDIEKFRVYVSSINTWKNIKTGTITIQKFSCGASSITDDRDGKVYSTTKIGNQCWMAENLNVGIRINGNVRQSQQTPTDLIEKYCYNNIENNCEIYGGLYEWRECMQYVDDESVQGICPVGWHIPSVSEWNTLFVYLNDIGYSSTKGKVLKAANGWNGGGNGTDLFDFTGLPAGRRYTDAALSFIEIGSYTYYWTSTINGPNFAYYKALYYDNDQIVQGYRRNYCGISVRCVKDL